MRKLLLTLLLIVPFGTCLARQVNETDRYLPLVKNGGGWSTRITLVNLDEKPAPFELEFRPPKGQFGKWDLHLRGNALTLQAGKASGTIPPGGVTVIETDGSGEIASTGYAALTRFGSELIGAEATLRNSATAADFSLPLSPAREDKVVLLFDNTEGQSTSLLWLSETEFAVATMVAYSDQGRELAKSTFEFYVKDSLAQHLFALQERFPELAGARGSVVIRLEYPTVGFYDEATFTAMALQSGANGSVVPVQAFAPSAWAPRRYYSCRERRSP